MTARRIFVTSFSVLPLPLFAFVILLAVRAHSNPAPYGDARLQSDLASLKSSAAATESSEAWEATRESLINSASKLKKSAKKYTYYKYPSDKLDFSPYGWMRYGPSGR